MLTCLHVKRAGAAGQLLKPRHVLSNGSHPDRVLQQLVWAVTGLPPCDFLIVLVILATQIIQPQAVNQII